MFGDIPSKMNHKITRKRVRNDTSNKLKLRLQSDDGSPNKLHWRTGITPIELECYTDFEKFDLQIIYMARLYS